MAKAIPSAERPHSSLGNQAAEDFVRASAPAMTPADSEQAPALLNLKSLISSGTETGARPPRASRLHRPHFTVPSRFAANLKESLGSWQWTMIQEILEENTWHLCEGFSCIRGVALMQENP